MSRTAAAIAAGFTANASTTGASHAIGLGMKREEWQRRPPSPSARLDLGSAVCTSRSDLLLGIWECSIYVKWPARWAASSAVIN
jgi:hypothetical protein